MLLVDDGDGHVVEVDALLDQRVRADEDLRLGGIALDGARQECDRDTQLQARLLEREEVLLRERLGRGHQHAALAGLDRAQERVQGDDGLAGADLALEQALHRGRLCEVGVDLLDRTFLMGRELEGKRRAVAGDQVAGLAERRGLLLLAPEAPARQPDLEHEQFLESQALAARFGGARVTRPVEGGERVDAERKLGSNARRDWIGMIVRVGQRLSRRARAAS